MDSQDRDNSKIRRREETLARRLGEALDQLKPLGAEKCPDAEVIAAYAEQTLEPAESGQWEVHFATCARCRKILRVLAASADTPLAGKEVTQLGELVSTVRAPVEITGGPAGRSGPKFGDWRVRWLAPALGMAAVLAVWFAMRPPWRVTDHGATETLVAQAPKEELPQSPAPAEPDRLSRNAAPQDQKTDAAAPPPARPSANPQSLSSPAQAPGKRQADAVNQIGAISPSAGNENGSLQENKKLDSPRSGREIQAPAIPPPPPPLPKAQAAMEVPAAPQSEARAELDTAEKQAPQAKTKASAMANAPARDKEQAEARQEAGATTGGAVAQQTPAKLQSNGRSDQAFAVMRPIQKLSSLLKSPSGLTFWRAGKSGMIERSHDAGKTWVPQRSPSQEDWLAGAAVSDSVCWVSGRNGAIARTMDGEDWERVAPPAQAAGMDGKLPYWVGVTTRDARSAVVTASDGRRFATADGGKTWQLQ
jgi:hypothetical protein